MKKSIKIISLTAASLLTLSVVVFSVLNITDVYTLEESVNNFLKSFYIILIIGIGSSLISFIISLSNK